MPHYPLELLFAHDQIVRAGHEALLIDAQNDDLTIEQVRDRLRRLCSRLPGDSHCAVVSVLALSSAGAARSDAVVRGAGRERERRSRSVRMAQRLRRQRCARPAATSCCAASPIKRWRGWPTNPWEQVPGCCFSPRRWNAAHQPRAGRHRHEGARRRSTFTTTTSSASASPSRLHRRRSRRGAGVCAWMSLVLQLLQQDTVSQQVSRARGRRRASPRSIAWIARGVDYIYFIDEIFGVGKNVLKLLEALAERDVKIGFQTRIDLWSEDTLDLLGRAGLHLDGSAASSRSPTKAATS